MESVFRKTAVFVLLLVAVIGCFFGEAEAAEPRKEVLSLSDAHELVRQKNPEVQSARARVQAARGEVKQASLRPNPSFTAEAENFGGSGRFDSTNSLEQKYVLRYMIETWDKRSLRTGVAQTQVTVARRRYQATKLDALAEANRAFYGILAAKKRLQLRRDLHRLAKRGLETVTKQVQAGKVSSIEQSRAQVEQSRAQIALKRARRDLEAARQKLASTWGENSLRNYSVKGDLPLPNEPKSLQAIRKHLPQNPVYRLAEEIINREKRSVKLANARGYPNVTVGGGYKRFNFTDDDAYIVNVSLPLPLFDVNQGKLQAQKNRLRSAKKNLDSVHNRLRTRLKSEYETIGATYQELVDLKKEVIPAARRAYQAIFKGFKAGKFDYLEVLDAQRTFFENRIQYVQSLKRFYQTQADIERLTATIGDNSDSSSGNDTQ